MALMYYMGIILVVICNGGECVSTETAITRNSTNNSSDSHTGKPLWLSELEDFFIVNYKEILLVSAGFMTASLIFSVGCFVSKYKTSSEKNEKEDTSVTLADEPLLDTLPTNHAYANEGSNGSDQRSYNYCDIHPDAKSNFSTSSKSTKRFMRESYDLVDRNRVKSSLVNENDEPNPYNHVTLDMEVTTYDDASFLKPRLEAKDPTYSHITDVPLKTNNIKQNATERPVKVTEPAKEKKDKKQKKFKQKYNPDTKKENKKSDRGKICDDSQKTLDCTIMINEVAKTENQKAENLKQNKSNNSPYSCVYKNPKVEEKTGVNSNEKVFILTENDDSSCHLDAVSDTDKTDHEDSTFNLEVICNDEKLEPAENLSDTDTSANNGSFGNFESNRSIDKESDSDNSCHLQPIIIDKEDENNILFHSKVVTDDDNLIRVSHCNLEVSSDDNKESSTDEYPSTDVSAEDSSLPTVSDDTSCPSGSDIESKSETENTKLQAPVAVNAMYEDFHLDNISECSENLIQL